jgi:hypothetical protein
MGTQPWERSSVEFVATGFLKPEITSLKISTYVNIILYYLKILLSTENIFDAPGDLKLNETNSAVAEVRSDSRT